MPSTRRGIGLWIFAGLDDPDLPTEGQDRAVADFYGATYLHLKDASQCLMVDPDWRPGLTLMMEWWSKKKTI